jgi:hypothetical protein
MPISGNRSLRTLDLTYKLFLIAGSVTLLIFSVIALDPKNAEGWGMLLGPTVGLLGIAALLGGIVRGFWCWRHRPLLILALSPIPVVIAGSISETVGNVTLAMWAVMLIIVPASWFAKGKRRYRENLALADQVARSSSSFNEGPASGR